MGPVEMKAPGSPAKKQCVADGAGGREQIYDLPLPALSEGVTSFESYKHQADTMRFDTSVKLPFSVQAVEPPSDCFSNLVISSYGNIIQLERTAGGLLVYGKNGALWHPLPGSNAEQKVITTDPVLSSVTESKSEDARALILTTTGKLIWVGGQHDGIVVSEQGDTPAWAQSGEAWLLSLNENVVVFRQIEDGMVKLGVTNVYGGKDANVKWFKGNGVPSHVAFVSNDKLAIFAPRLFYPANEPGLDISESKLQPPTEECFLTLVDLSKEANSEALTHARLPKLLGADQKDCIFAHDEHAQVVRLADVSTWGSPPAPPSEGSSLGNVEELLPGLQARVVGSFPGIAYILQSRPFIRHLQMDSSSKFLAATDGGKNPSVECYLAPAGRHFAPACSLSTEYLYGMCILPQAPSRLNSGYNQLNDNLPHNADEITIAVLTKDEIRYYIVNKSLTIDEVQHPPSQLISGMDPAALERLLQNADY